MYRLTVIFKLILSSPIWNLIGGISSIASCNPSPTNQSNDSMWGDAKSSNAYSKNNNKNIDILGTRLITESNNVTTFILKMMKI